MSDLNITGYKTEGEGTVKASYLEESLNELQNAKADLVENWRTRRFKANRECVSCIDDVVEKINVIFGTFDGENVLSFTLHDVEGENIDIQSEIIDALEMARKLKETIRENESRMTISTFSLLMLAIGSIFFLFSTSFLGIFSLTGIPWAIVWLCISVSTAHSKEKAESEDPSTPPERLDYLAKHFGSSVQWNVARNPSTLPKTLSYLHDSFYIYIKKSVAEHPNTPIEILEKMAVPKDISGAKALLVSPQAAMLDQHNSMLIAQSALSNISKRKASKAEVVKYVDDSIKVKKNEDDEKLKFLKLYNAEKQRIEKEKAEKERVEKEKADEEKMRRLITKILAEKDGSQIYDVDKMYDEWKKGKEKI